MLVSILALAQYTSFSLLEKQAQLLLSLRSSPLHKGFPISIAFHCVGERSSEPVARLNSEFFRSFRLSMPVYSYLVDFVFWQALYGRWCPAVMSTVSRCMSRFVRDNRRDIGVRVLLALAALSRREHENATTPLSQGLPSPQKRGRLGRFSHCLEDYLGWGVPPRELVNGG